MDIIVNRTASTTVSSSNGVGIGSGSDIESKSISNGITDDDRTTADGESQTKQVKKRKISERKHSSGSGGVVERKVRSGGMHMQNDPFNSPPSTTTIQPSPSMKRPFSLSFSLSLSLSLSTFCRCSFFSSCYWF
jgi:hypothetical protein